LIDKYEKDSTTDPLLIDTDHDGLNDPEDLFPLSFMCIRDLDNLGLVAWWAPSFDAEQKIYFAKDIWDTDGSSQLGSLSGYNLNLEGKDMVSERGGDLYFSLNRGINANEQLIEVDHHTDLSPKYEFTIASWIIWEGETASGIDQGALITKGTNYALYLTRDGSLQFTIKRRVHETCDWPCGDKDRDSDDTVYTVANIIKPGELTHVVATFGKNSEYMRIYINGYLQAYYNVINKHGYWNYRRYTRYIYTNQYPLTIGNMLDGSLPFKGMVKDIQFFSREMNSDDVEKLYNYGLCVPNP